MHTYTKTALAFVNATFPGRIKVVLGDSTVAIPRYARTHPEAGCDLCIVDGGHAYSVAAADIRNMGIALSGGRRSLMLVDDYGYGVNRPQVNVAVDDLVRAHPQSSTKIAARLCCCSFFRPKRTLSQMIPLSSSPPPIKTVCFSPSRCSHLLCLRCCLGNFSCSKCGARCHQRATRTGG